MEPVKVIVLGFVPYKFKDKDDKEVKGTTVWFIEEKPQNDEYGQGHIPRKVTMDYDFKDALAGLKFPYLCEPKMATRFTSKGAKTVVEDIIPHNPVTIKVESLVVK